MIVHPVMKREIQSVKFMLRVALNIVLIYWVYVETGFVSLTIALSLITLAIEIQTLETARSRRDGW